MSVTVIPTHTFSFSVQLQISWDTVHNFDWSWANPKHSFGATSYLGTSSITYKTCDKPLVAGHGGQLQQFTLCLHFQHHLGLSTLFPLLKDGWMVTEGPLVCHHCSMGTLQPISTQLSKTVADNIGLCQNIQDFKRINLFWKGIVIFIMISALISSTLHTLSGHKSRYTCAAAFPFPIFRSDRTTRANLKLSPPSPVG